MRKESTVITCRNMMYVQQLKHLPNGMTSEELFQHVEEKLSPMKWAGIVHDKDLKADGKTLAEPQIHIMMQFKNERSIEQVAKDIGDKSQYIEKWDSRPMNGFAYLIHATDGARHLHQYSADEVTANFDYVSAIQKVMSKFNKNDIHPSVKKIDNYLNKIANGDITLKNAKNLLSGAEYAKAFRKLEAAHSLFLEREAENRLSQMEANHEIVQVHWIYGPTETGKTFLAEKMAAKLGNYYKTTTLKDPFQFYQAEPVILLDELRPGSIPYSELLAMFDPFSGGKVKMSSRYVNKALACHTFFVTTPYSPSEFYENAVLPSDRDIDCPEQFYRRLTSILHMQPDVIEKVEYDSSSKSFLTTDTKPNIYSKGNHRKIIVSHLFDEID